MLKIETKDNLELAEGHVFGVPTTIFSSVTKAADAASNKLRNKVILAMRNTPRTGKRYAKDGGRVHIASGRGNAPAPDTGNLMRSIIKDVKTTKDSVVFTVGVSKGAPYAEDLEDPKKLNRPIFRPFVQWAERELGAEISRILTRVGSQTVRKE